MFLIRFTLLSCELKFLSFYFIIIFRRNDVIIMQSSILSITVKWVNKNRKFSWILRDVKLKQPKIFSEASVKLLFPKNCGERFFSKIIFQQSIALLKMTSYTYVFLQCFGGNTQGKCYNKTVEEKSRIWPIQSHS